MNIFFVLCVPNEKLCIIPVTKFNKEFMWVSYVCKLGFETGGITCLDLAFERGGINPKFWPRGGDTYDPYPPLHTYGVHTV